MARPSKYRWIRREPSVTFFKPRGIPLRALKIVTLTVEGYETIRLSDVEGLDQESASSKMGISRQTYGRVLAQARKTLADAIVHGYALEIEGGNYLLVDDATVDME